MRFLNSAHIIDSMHATDCFFCFKSTSKEADYIFKTMGHLDIGEPSTCFKRKPVIIIVVGMAGNVF